MRKGVKFRSSGEPIERRTRAPAPYDTPAMHDDVGYGDVKNLGKHVPLKSLVREPSL